MVTLYTVQEPGVVETLMKKGIVHPKKELEYEYWRRAYDWIRSKMVQRRLIQDMSCGMFWAFDKIGEAKLHDGMLITLDIHESLLLPSEYNHWHSVLNNGPIVVEEDGVDLDKKYDCIVNKGQAAIEATWDLCLGNMKDGEVTTDVAFNHELLWQYTFAYICKDCVKDIQVNKVDKRI